jgi:hypothetical protein
MHMFESQMGALMFNHRKITLVVGIAIAIVVWLLSVN